MRTMVGLLLGLLALPACAGDAAETTAASPNWLTVLLGFLGGAATTFISVWAARRARLGALDQAVHVRRLALYPSLVACTTRLAVFFPRAAKDKRPLSPQDCAEIGRSMSRWYYFGGGGLLLSENARDAYTRLALVLTRASLAKTLRVPMLPDDSNEVNVDWLKEYWRRIVAAGPVKLEDWTFGIEAHDSASPEVRFRDYVLLQKLSSQLRTALTRDIRGRRGPS